MFRGTYELIVIIALVCPATISICEGLLAQQAVALFGLNDSQVFDAKERFRIDYADIAMSLSFSPNGGLIAGTDRNGNINVWESNSGKLKYHFDEKSGFPRAFFSTDGKRLAASLSQDMTAGPVKMWDLATGRDLYSVDASGPGIFLPGGKEFLTSKSGTFQVRDVRKGEIIREFKLNKWKPSASFRPVFNSTGTKIAAYLVAESAVKIWSIDSNHDPVVLKGHEKSVRAFSFSFSEKLVATGGSDKEVRIWSAEDGKLLHKTAFTNTPIWLAFSPDERWLAVGFAGGKTSISILDATKGKEALTIEAEKGPSGPLAFHPQGTMLAGARAGCIHVWDLTSAKPVPRD